MATDGNGDWIRLPTQDTRGQATGIANMFLALLVGAIMTWIVTEITTPLMDDARDVGTDSVGSQATEWLQIFLTNQPAIFLFISFFSLLVLSVYQREVLG